MRRAVRTLAGLVLVLATGCSAVPTAQQPAATQASPAPSSGQAPPPAQKSPIKIGVLADVTGAAAFAGAQERLNADLRIEQINAAGGVNGHLLEAHYVDPGSDPARAQQLAVQLVQQDNVDVLMGGVLTPECAGVAGLAAQLQVVYLTAEGCAGDQVTAQNCNKYTFRLYPAGVQTTLPLAQFMVQTYGKRWGILYPDYAAGQSSVDTYSAALANAGGSITLKIPVPLGEANVTPYVTKIPQDGSIDGLINAENGSDLARIISVMNQFGIQNKLPIVGSAFAKDFFAGVFPDSLTGSVSVGSHLDPPAADNQFDQAYVAAFRAHAQQDPAMASVAGGGDNISPGVTGYPVYANISFLRLGMQAAGYESRADMDRLVAALESISSPISADFPGGGFEMHQSDHQGKMDLYVYKINGQQENVLTVVHAHDLPQIGTCQV